MAKPIELPGSRPLQFEFSQDLGSRLIEWPVDHCIKVLCFYHPDDDAALKREQTDKARLGLRRRAQDRPRDPDRDHRLEVRPARRRHGRARARRALRRRPQARLVEARTAGLRRGAWRRIDDVIAARDPYCRGVVLLGLEAPIEALEGELRRRPGGPRGSEASRSGERFSPRRRSAGSRAKSATTRRSTPWPRSSERWSISGCRSKGSARGLDG